MGQHFVRDDMRFSSEHMEAIRRHFNRAQQYAGDMPSAASDENKNDERLLLGAWAKVIALPFRRWSVETELLSPDWRALAAYLVFGVGLAIIFGVLLLPHQ